MKHLHVRREDNAYDVVNDTTLNNLIVGHRIREFYRPSEGRWIVPGSDPVRGEGGAAYRGPERRRYNP